MALTEAKRELLWQMQSYRPRKKKLQNNFYSWLCRFVPRLCYFENYSSDYLEFRVCRPQKPQRENSENSLHEDTVDTLGHLKCDFHCFGRPRCYCYIQHSNQNQSILDPTDRVRALRKLETRRIFFRNIPIHFLYSTYKQHKS